MKSIQKTILAAALTTAVAGAGDAKEITQACQAGGGFFTAYPGSYTVKLKIGSHTFLDELVISAITRKPGMANAVESFKGTYTVPGIFSTEVLNGRLGIIPHKHELSFKILATENGESYPVYFQATGDACLMTGEAFSPTPEQKMGTFEMMKSTSDCQCHNNL